MLMARSPLTPVVQIISNEQISHSTDSMIDRLESLEQHVDRMDKALHAGYVAQPDEAEAPQDTEIFARSPPEHSRPASLSSHINALKKTLLPAFPLLQQAPRSAKVGGQCSEQLVTKHYLRNCPSLIRLKFLLGLYFEHLNPFFPCLDEGEFMQRWVEIENDLVHDGNSLCLLVRPSSRTFLMSMCLVLAVATYLDPCSHGEDQPSISPGWKYVSMAEHIAEGDRYHSTQLLTPDLDLVRYYVVKAMYMIHTEKLTAASHAISTAVHLAFVLSLNDESTWDDCRSIAATNARRRLWWTLFYLDRRIAQKCWRPYLIRESEIRVDDSIKTTETETSIRTTNGDNDGDTESHVRTTDRALSSRYVQTEIDWARLWALVWDSLFAVRPTSTGRDKQEEIEILDARILHSQRQTHESLHWNTSHLPNYLAACEPEAQVRARLVTYVRINLLRLLIRQSWKHTTATDTRESRVCIELASDTIEAILAYMASRTNPIPFGLNAVECVVECICHLVPHVTLTSSNMNWSSGDDVAMPSLTRAIEFLQNLSTTLGAARRALDALGEIVDRGWLQVFRSKSELELDYYAPLFQGTAKGGVDSGGPGPFDELFSLEWSDACGSTLDAGSFI
ncbi:Fungal specific transcription factor domain-containing protein [Cladophialophora immunda]|nr:Fungal specific transcription factor domain-containing protein [Cladophialophora immunda]